MTKGNWRKWKDRSYRRSVLWGGLTRLRVSTPRGRTTKYQLPVCVVPDIFALNGSTQQASGSVPQVLPEL